MKTFAGVFMSLFAEEYNINIIDEPEAFLHPPQALLLGQMMGRELDSDKQLFIATVSLTHYMFYYQSKKGSAEVIGKLEVLTRGYPTCGFLIIISLC
ncbi:hypothetical protein ESB13_04125 [Filimonas effusa]|uniref:Uncharacterized protein n=2 Tax=Filimonas effusa TaxID=2508721 RepID=A0A4Q1DB51_9BACT|nr:hypothetical protein ESB13_04125 [Filimonas effusa]